MHDQEHQDEHGQDHEEVDSSLQPLQHGGANMPFPVPMLLVFGGTQVPFVPRCLGYALVLLLDKVAFDSHAVFDQDTGHSHSYHPIEEHFVNKSKQSIESHCAGIPSAEQNCLGSLDENIQGYLSNKERFSVRMNTALQNAGNNHHFCRACRNTPPFGSEDPEQNLDYEGPDIDPLKYRCRFYLNYGLAILAENTNATTNCLSISLIRMMLGEMRSAT